MSLRTSTTTSAKSRAARKTAAPDVNALDLLKSDHRAIEQLFDSFHQLMKSRANRSTQRQKNELVGNICRELTLHADIEEQIFYPAARKAIRNDELMDEALVEHRTVRALVDQLSAMRAGDALYDANVIVLAEYVRHHVHEEERTLFAQVRRTPIDLAALGQRLRERKEELREQLASDR